MIKLTDRNGVVFKNWDKLLICSICQYKSNEMKFYIIIIFYLFIPILSIGQVDKNLSKFIDSLAYEDQKYRGLIRKIHNKDTDTLTQENVTQKILLVDSLNFIHIQSLFNKHGYLGFDKIGERSSRSFWLLVQHADKHRDFQDSVLTAMKIEADRGNAFMSNYAYLLDRVKVNKGEPQVYGTQMMFNSAKTTYEPRTVIEPEKLNERRKEVGLDTIEKYIKSMNKRYYKSLKKK